MPAENVTPIPRRRPGRPLASESSEPVRNKLIRATISLVAAHGVADVNGSQVAAVSSVSPAAVNYGFGSWFGLVAEAGSVVYVEYVAEIWAAVTVAPYDPESRLRAYIRAQIRWANDMQGWSAIFNYPFSARGVTAILQEKFGHVMNSHFQLNHARLVRLTIDLRDGLITPFDFDTSDFPRDELLADVAGLARGTMVGWTALGMMVWNSRGPTLEARIPEIVSRQGAIMSFAEDEIVASILRDSQSS